MKPVDSKPMVVPVLILDEEEAIDDLSVKIYGFHQKLASSYALYSPGVSDEERRDTCGRIQSVLSVTFCTYFGQSPADRFIDLFDQATYLAEHLAKDHLFQDGNKRTALTASFAVLRRAGIYIEFVDTDDPETNLYYSWIQDIVSGTRTREMLSEELRQSATIGRH